MPYTLDNNRGDDLETVLGQLTQTIEWCVPRVRVAHPKSCLRTPKLGPNVLAGWRKDVVGSVASYRHQQLGCNPPLPATGLCGGRLLLYDPDINLASGIEEEETLGYVDINNIPPWDTWIAYIVEPEAEGLQWVQYLLSWVPPEFIPLVGGGIDVCPDECIRWLDCEECALSHILRDRGIF